MTAEQILRELLDEFSIEDYIYNIRENECLGWGGPRVTRFADLMAAAREILK